jgi:Tol biopolymer transport system component
MTIDSRLERQLPQILTELAPAHYPDYIDDVLATTVRLHQRASWTFPERWLPMAELLDIPLQRVRAPRIPWRLISLAIATIALLFGAVAVFIGAQPRLPASFGPARNGVIAYDADGDIYTADPVTGRATAIVTGPAVDEGPRFSADGTQVIFARKIDTGRAQLYVARSDGTDLKLLTPEPVTLFDSNIGQTLNPYQFSPDGRSVLIASSKASFPLLSIAHIDGSGVRDLDLGMAAFEPSFRSVDGAEVLFVGNQGNTRTGSGLYAYDLAGGVLRTIVAPSDGFDVGAPVWSPDGSQIAYQKWTDANGITGKTHVVSADGTRDIELPSPDEAVWNLGSEWSNDGKRLFLQRGYTSGHEDVRAVVVPADGSSPGIEIPNSGALAGACCATWTWSPDDSQILGTPTDVLGRPMHQVLVDPLTGKVGPTPWSSTSDPAWQRLAP